MAVPDTQPSSETPGAGPEVKRRRPRTAPLQASEDVESRLLTAALRLFGKHGYAAVSVRDVARAAGVTTPNGYYYFKSKQGLYLRLLHELLERRSTAVRMAAQEEGDPLTRLRRVLEAYIWFDKDAPIDREAQLFLLREQYGLGTQMYSELVTSYDESNRRAIRQVLEDGIAQGIFRPTRLEHTTIAIIGVMGAFIRRAALGARLRPADGVAQVMDGFVEGLRVRD